MNNKSQELSILVSGQSGPLGNALISLNSLDTKIFSFRSVDCNLLDLAATKAYFKTFSAQHPDRELAYFHVAALSGGSHLSERAPASLFTDNMMMGINALEAARESGIKRVLMVLSTACYSSKLESPREEELHSLPIETAEYGYGYAKRMLEVLMRAYNKQYDMQISCVLVNGIIGRGMHFGEDRSILPAALIKKFYEYRNSSDNILLWGDGSPVREYTSAKDLARAMIWCVRNQDRNTLLNIGNTARISVKDLANTIALKMGIELSRLRFEGNAGTGRQLQSTNNTRFVAMSNFTYESIESAIDSAIQYFESEVLAK